MNYVKSNRLKKIAFRSWHRGTKEMDLVLGKFSDHYLQTFDEAALAQFEAILNYDDADLYAWLTGKKTPPSEVMTPIFKKLVDFANRGRQ